MTDNNEIGRKKITFSTLGSSAKKIDFTTKKIDFSSIKDQIDDKNKNNPSQVERTQYNQFRKPNFNNFNKPSFNVVDIEGRSNVDMDDFIAKNKTSSTQKDQFRKPNFEYTFDGGKVKQNAKEDKNISNNNAKSNNQKNFDGGGFRKFDRTFNTKNQSSDSNFVKNNTGGNNVNKTGNSNFNTQKNDNKNRKPFTTNNQFFKKSNQVKVKLSDKVKNSNVKEHYRKTANTGGNVDKYSINSMLQTFSNTLDIDTEIDDVLGNVINVKPATINSSYSFQKERKVRTSKNDGAKKVNFNKNIVRDIEIYNDSITISNLADQMAVSAKTLINILRNEGIDVEDSDIIDGDTAQLVAENYGHNIVRIADDDVENEFVANISEDRNDLKSRAPIVTIMGHVDHGKTTLLDTIRRASVASGEAGGITQHIGAYRTKVGDKWITFLDTPGHAAFTQMRMRGAQATDIVVIVIAADDGIMPQTIEAISHAKVAGCPIIVAINKIDKPEANIERAKNMLLQYELVPEELGGDVMVVPISAKEGRNVDKLLEAILLQAEILELKAYYDGGVDGVVVESKLDKKRGALVTVIVKNGVLSQGDFIIAGEQYGKIKGMFDENGKMLKTAEPSVPVEILGLNATPNAGEVFYAVRNEKDAKEMVAYRQEKAKQTAQQTKTGVSVDDVFLKMKGGANHKNIYFIIKADTKGSLEAIVNTLEKIQNDEYKLNIVHTGVGAVSESDVLLATTCGGYIFTFNTQKSDKNVLMEAEKQGIEIKDYKIIYELFDDAKDILNGKLKAVVKKNTIGHAEVKMIFDISKVGKIAGCLVKDGIVSRGSNVDVIRNGEVVCETKCHSLKHEKDNVKEVQGGQECGIGLEKIDEVQTGDVLEFYTIKDDKKNK